MKPFTLFKQTKICIGDYVENMQFDDRRGGIVVKVGASPYYGDTFKSAYIVGWWLADDGSVINTWAEWYPVHQLHSLGSAKKLYRKGLIPSAEAKVQ